MESDNIVDELNEEKILFFVNALNNSSWMLTADISTIDNIMNIAATIQNDFLKKEQMPFHLKVINNYPKIDFKKSLDLLIENCIKNPNLNEYLTLYAVKKYESFNPSYNLCNILENIFKEINIGENLTQLYEIISDNKVVNVNGHKVNILLQEINSFRNEFYEYKIINALKTQASVLLNAVNLGCEPNGEALLNGMIECLESQSNLKLWFALMKEKNMTLILNLCSKYPKFLNAVLKFFDRFAEEIETNYDEDLNFEYSHLNLDFDEFLRLLELFLKDSNLKKVINDYIENKILYEDKNFLFWIDVKACNSDQ